MLTTLLRSYSPATFLTEIYLDHPLVVAHPDATLATLATWETFAEVLRPQRGAPVDGLVVRDGKLLPVPPPCHWWEAKTLLCHGASIVLRNVDRRHAALSRLARGLEEALGGRAAIQLYATPAHHHSFGWHYDVEEVFIVQTVGRKTYHVRRNTVDPYPLLETMPRDMRYEDERSTDLASYELGPGQLLYIPSGWWHRAEAAEDSLSVSIGVFAETALDGLTRLRETLRDDPIFRRRLPPGDPADRNRLISAARARLEQLASDRQFLEGLFAH